METLTQLRTAVRSLLAERETVVMAIDGNCTAGKTTLAALLAEEFSGNIFHMDEFFLQPHQRTPERLAQPGGNVDYERFQQEVLLPLRRGEPASYRPYDCSTQSLKAQVSLPRRQLNIVEGTYSCHPHFRQPYDLTVFLSVSPETQQLRVLQRPAFKHRLFFEVWIPMEQRYFQTFAIRESCHLVCSGEEPWD